MTINATNPTNFTAILCFMVFLDGRYRVVEDSRNITNDLGTDYILMFAQDEHHLVNTLIPEMMLKDYNIHMALSEELNGQ